MKNYNVSERENSIFCSLIDRRFLKSTPLFLSSLKNLSPWQWNRLSAHSHRLCFTGAHDGRGFCRRGSLWDDRPQVSLLVWFIWAGQFLVNGNSFEPTANCKASWEPWWLLWARRYSAGWNRSRQMFGMTKEISVYLPCFSPCHLFSTLNSTICFIV